MKAKKSLGQNFLKSEVALRKIVETGEIKPDDVILEIGPGKGVLTKKLLEQINPTQTLPKGKGSFSLGEKVREVGGYVIAVEKDRELLEFLQEKFRKEI